MALGAEVVDLIGLHLLDDPDQIGAVREVAVVEGELRGLSLLTPLVRVRVEVVDPAGVERRRAPLDAVDWVARLPEALRPVAAVRPREARYQGGLGRGCGLGVRGRCG